DVPLRLGSRSEKDRAADILSCGKVFLQDLVFFKEALKPQEAARLASAGLLRDFVSSSARSAEKTNALFDLYLAGFDEPSAKIQAQLATIKVEEEQIKERGATTLIFEEKKGSEPMAHVLPRGNYATKGDKVTPTT